MNVESGLQLDLIGGVRRRGKLAAVIAGCCLLAAFWIAMALPNEYMSSATMFVEPQAVSDQLVQSGVGESDLNQRLNLMSAQILSRPRLSRIIDELDLYEEESEDMLREEVIEYMRSRISIDPVVQEFAADRRRRDAEQINTFVITFMADQPQVAASVAQRLANDFIREHIEARVQVTQKSLEFINAEQVRLAQRTREVESQIGEIKTENSGSLPEDMNTNQRMMERALSDLREAQRDVDVARGEMSFWDNQSLAAVASAPINSDTSPIRKLQALELQLSQYRARGFTEKHPDIVATEQEVLEVRKQIEVEEDEEVTGIAPINIAKQNAEASKKRAELQFEAANQEIERLRTQVDTFAKSMEATPRVAAQLELLERERRQLSESFRDYAQRRQEASVQVDLERRQLGEQFRILESAFADPTPSAPNRPLIIVMGLLMGIIFGAAAGVVLEGADSSFHGPRDLQGSLGIPVLAAIPRILLEPDRAEARRRLLRQGAAAALVTLFSLGGGATTYMVVNGMPGFLQAVFQGEEEPAAVSAPSANAEPGDDEGRL